MKATNSSPDVTAIIPAFNAAAFLGEAVESVLRQDGFSIEIIVVNDGSSDGTAAIAEAMPQVLLINRRNGGSGAARNTGLAAATSPLVAFLDADDLWPDGRLALMVDALTADFDAVFGKAEQFGEGRNPTPPQPALLAGTLLIRREACTRIGPFQEDLKVGEFIDWWARAEDAAVRWTQIPEVVLRRRIHTTNTGIVQAGSRTDYARVLRAALERRRGAS